MLQKKRIIIKSIPKSGIVPAESILIETGIIQQAVEIVLDTAIKFFAIIGFICSISWLFTG